MAWTTLIRGYDQAQPALQIQLLESEQHRQSWLAIFRPDEILYRPFQHRTEDGSGLYYASSMGLVNTCQMLLESGADVNARGGRYGAALRAASVKGHQQVVQLLLDAGADVNAQIQRRGYYGAALQAASGSGHQQVVQLLLDAGADVNAGALQAA